MKLVYLVFVLINLKSVQSSLILRNATVLETIVVEAKPADCFGKDFIASQYFLANTEPHNVCTESGLNTYFFVTKNEPHVWRTCSKAVSCKDGQFFFDGTHSCSRPNLSCYPLRQSCYYPKGSVLKTSECFKKLKDNPLSDVCSVGEKKQGCSPDSTVRTVAWVMTPDLNKTYVSSLSISLMQSMDKERSFYSALQNEAFGEESGNNEYCSTHSLPSERVKEWSDDKSKFRILNELAEVPYFSVKNCETPVLCYGYEGVTVYGFEQKRVGVSCKSCQVACDDEFIKVVIPETKKKVIRICGRHDCYVEHSEGTMFEFRRDFHQKISDEKVDVEIMSDEGDFLYRIEAGCPLVEICTAIDCNLCWVRMVNPKCYLWFHWIMTIGVLYVVLMIVGLSLILVKPVFVVVITCFMTCFKVFRSLYRKSSRLVGKRVRKTREWIEDDEVNALEETALVEDPGRNDRLRRNGGLARLQRMSLLIVGVICLASPSQCVSPCSLVAVDNIQSSSCEERLGVMHCKVASLVNVPIISYDQTSCLKFLSPVGEVIGMLQITPKDLSFKCEKRRLYYTRDVKMDFDYNIRCPGAGECSADWCRKYEKSRSVPGFPGHYGPHTAFCRSGPACAGHGCFYCTSTCHVMRYFPNIKNSRVFEVFECTRWDPSGSFFFSFTGSMADFQSHVTLIHGESIELKPDLKVTLTMTVQDKMPVLSKQFLYDENLVYMVDACAAGQPVPGKLGSLQCQTRDGAYRFRDGDCFYAPRTCNCQVGDGFDSCDCTNTNIDKLATPKSKLPLSIGKDYLRQVRGVPYLQSSAYGSATIKVQTSARMVGTRAKEVECKAEIMSLEGCHSCTIGANVTYTCTSLVPQTVVAHCDNDVYFGLDCNLDTNRRNSRVHLPVALVDINCKLQCNKAVLRLQGTLISIGYAQANEGSHIQLENRGEFNLAETADWFKSVWSFLGWFNVIWITGLVTVFGLLVLMGVLKARNMIKHKDN